MRSALALLRVALMTALQYRSNFVLEFFTGLGAAAMAALPLVFVFDHATTVAGWTFHESLLVTAFFLILTGLVGSLVEPNLSAVVEGVRTGQLDYLLLKPVDAQVLASAQRFAPARLWDAIAGLVIGGWGLSALPAPTPAGVAAAAALLLAGLAAMYSVWIGVVCLSFWFVRVDNLRFLLSALTDAGRWPVHVYKGWARLALTVVLPVALVTSYPALALLGRLDPGLGVQALVVATVMLAVSRWMWRRALGHYTSASS